MDHVSTCTCLRVRCGYGVHVVLRHLVVIGVELDVGMKLAVVGGGVEVAFDENCC